MTRSPAPVSRPHPIRALAGAFGLAMLAPAAAEPPGPPLVLSDPAVAASAPVVGMRADGGFVTAWRGDAGAIVARRHAADGTPLGAPIAVKPADGAFASDLRLTVNDGGDFVITWEQFSSASGRFGIEARRYDRDGLPRAAVLATEIPSGSSFGSDVAIDEDGDFTVVWRDADRVSVPLLLIPYGTADLGNSRVQARRFGADGQPIGGTARIAFSLTDPTLIRGLIDQLPPAIASDAAGNALVTWSTRDGSGPSAVFARRLDASGRVRGLAFRVDPRGGGGAYGSDVAMNADGAAIVTWQRPHATGSNSSSGNDVLARRYDAAGRAGPVLEVGDLVAIGTRASVAINAAGEAVIAWPATTSDFCCFPPLVVAQRLDAQGQRVGGNLVLSTQYSEDSDAGIAADGRAVVVWSARNPLPTVFASLLPPP